MVFEPSQEITGIFEIEGLRGHFSHLRKMGVKNSIEISIVSHFGNFFGVFGKNGFQN